MSEAADRWAVNLAGATVLGRYRVERMIGGGGMANVYLAQDEQLEIPVVVKVPHAAFLAEAGFRERFDRETRDLVALQHPHIVRILARGEHEGLPFLVMQFLKGGSLGDRMRKAKGPMPFAEIEPWVRDIGRALDFIHEQGIVHRDIKPDNVLFDEYGHAYLSDFGIAKAVGGADTGLTVTGATPGSPAYMAPEQPRTSSLTGQSDQYSFAAALYEALSGRPTFEGETAVDVLIQKQSKLPLHLAETTPEVPRAAANAIMRGLAKEPEERFATCSELVQAMFTGPAVAPVPTPAPTPEAPTPEAPTPEARGAPEATSVLPERPARAAPPAVPPPRTTSVGHTVTAGGSRRMMWVVATLALLVVVVPLGAVFMSGRGDDGSADVTTADAPESGEIGAFHSPKPPKDEDPGLPPALPEAAGKDRPLPRLAAEVVGEYRIDKAFLEKQMRLARERRKKLPRGSGSWSDLERAVRSGMELSLFADARFRLVPPAHPDRGPQVITGNWQRMDDVVVLKPDLPRSAKAKRGPGVFEVRVTGPGRLTFVVGKMGIPLEKR